MNGKILDTVTVGNSTLAMKYDSNGLRTKKGSIKYYYDSSNNLIGMVNGNNTLLFYYDESGSPTSFSHNGTMYFYIKNLQGDICKIVDASGSVIANYTYDAWGKLLSVKDASGNSISNLTDVALLNPLRYRGYVYDEETGLYYLQSRYYDPTIGRFINADILFDTESGSPLSTNMFAYCENNCISGIDPKGTYYIKNFNCYAYAFGINNRWMIPGQKDNCGYLMPTYYTINQVVKWVTKTFGKKVRTLSGKDGKINKGEYRIAFRVCIYKRPLVYPQKYGPFYTATLDFHFWKQDPKTQKWWDKPGEGAIRYRGNRNPNQKNNWYYNTFYYQYKMWYGSGKTFKSLDLYYNSNTIYLAYKGKFWSK